MGTLFPLQVIEESLHDMLRLDALLDLPPRFFITKLIDKPQNPILDTLKADWKQPLRPLRIPAELATLVVEKTLPPVLSAPKSSIWDDAMKSEGSTKSRILSWDTLRTTRESTASATAFLSEQDASVFSSARYHVMPRLYDPLVHLVHVSAYDLFQSLKMVVLGTSSTIHTWNDGLERFVQQGVPANHTGALLIDGRDEVISKSIIERFLSIGSVLRRLDNLVSNMRSKSVQREGPTTHAFTHTLSTILRSLREDLEHCPPSIGDTQTTNLATTWMNHARFEDTLLALAELCCRSLNTGPKDYTILDTEPATLLSRIYQHLNQHIDRQSSRETTGTLAYLLTNTSKDYLHTVCQSVGFSPQDVGHHVGSTRRKDKQLASLEDEDLDDQGDVLFPDEAPELYPEFFSDELRQALSPAKRSLRLLQAARPDHPLLRTEVSRIEVRWVWTDKEVVARWNEEEDIPEDPLSATESEAVSEGLAHFKVFELEPGSQLFTPAFASNGKPNRRSDYRSFMATFPSCLPSITPTLTDLRTLVFTPLSEHVSRLSATLITLFMAPDTPMHFHTHLMLLRSYLLLTSPAFKSRLTAALFSDAGSSEADEIAMFKHCHLRQTNNTTEDTPSRPWAVGLAAALTERDTWPPGGADLSFYLRTVIVDSLDRRPCRDEDTERTGRGQVISEAEFRLGFAIRDLPTGSGRDRWLDPMCIEALDFLYMDYKPPHPMEVLITPDIMSKYQRVFAFILRLLRVESVSASLYRMTRKGTQSLFPTLTQSNKTLLHFRFISHSFVSAVSAHVSSTAIAGNFDPFLSKLESGNTNEFTDVFALAKSHSSVLDDILSACLLRSGQRAVGDLMRGALETVLELGILAGELKCGSVEEYQAASRLEDLYASFKGKLQTLTKVLRALSLKNGPSSLHSVDVSGRVEGQRQSIGGADSLYHLLIRLDSGEWWSGSRNA